jgi:hypothetical protein
MGGRIVNMVTLLSTAAQSEMTIARNLSLAKTPSAGQLVDLSI